MRLSLIGGVLVITIVGSLGGLACTPTLAPVYAPASPAGLAPAGTPFTAQQVEQATAQGAMAKGWTVVERSPGVVVAEISSGPHRARVRILSDQSGWRIVHEQSSPGLRYGHDDRHGDIIHRRYNHWVHMLDESIRHELAAPPLDTPPPPPPVGALEGTPPPQGTAPPVPSAVPVGAGSSAAPAR